MLNGAFQIGLKFSGRLLVGELVGVGVRRNFVTGRVDSADNVGVLIGYPAKTKERSPAVCVGQKLENPVHIPVNPRFVAAPLGFGPRRGIIQNMKPLFNIERQDVHKERYVSGRTAFKIESR